MPGIELIFCPVPDASNKLSRFSLRATYGLILNGMLLM